MWCYYCMIVIQHWMRQFDVGAEWCSLSHCGRGLEYRTQFQTHVSVIYRSVFHRRAVQGLRNACSVLPGLSACRLCLLLLASDGHTNAHWCMHECTYANLLSIHTRMCRHTHMKTSRSPPLHTTVNTQWLPCEPHHHPRQHPGKPSLLCSERQERCELHGGGGDDDDDHTSYVSFLSFPKQLLTSFQLAVPAKLTCNLKQTIESLWSKAAKRWNSSTQ